MDPRFPVAAVAGALVGIGVWLVRRTQADRPTREAGTGGYLRLRLLPPEAVERWTLLLFTSPYCGPCTQTPGIVDKALGMFGRHLPLIEIDVRDHPDLLADAGIQETPTLLLVDPVGRIQLRHVGNPSPSKLQAGLEVVLGPTNSSRAGTNGDGAGPTEPPASISRDGGR